jgi:hypothetical protein
VYKKIKNEIDAGKRNKNNIPTLFIREFDAFQIINNEMDINDNNNMDNAFIRFNEVFIKNATVGYAISVYDKIPGTYDSDDDNDLEEIMNQYRADTSI